MPAFPDLPAWRRLLGVCLLGSAATVGAAPWGFFACGDLPYGEGERRPFEQLLADAVARRSPFLVHVGDIKGGGAPCDAAAYERIADLFRAQPVPVVYTPGDNEWTDCHRPSAGGYDPIERLAFLRNRFFADPDVLRLSALGAVQPVPGYPEVYWFVRQGVLFAVLHVVGSHDNARPPGRAGEQPARVAANRALMTEALEAAQAEGVEALVVVFHADPAFEQPGSLPGYEALFAELDRLRGAFRGPILAIHGDTHRFRFDHPFAHPASGEPDRRFTRLEVPGSPTVGAIWVTIDPEATPAFAVERLYPTARALLLPEG